MNIHLIVNPNAGKKTGLAVSEQTQETLERHGARVTTGISTYPGRAVELAAAVRALPEEPSAVIAVGGDGTLFEVLNGLLRNRTDGDDVAPLPFPVGQIPVGTGNSFIKDLGIETPEDGVTAILQRKTRSVDVGTFVCGDGPFHFINLLGTGFVSNVAHRAGRYKRWGALSYIIGVLQETIALSPGHITLTVDGTRLEREGLFIEICNSRYTGGNMLIAPDAEIDDGLFDVILMEPVSRRKLLSLFPRIFSGTHVKDPVIEIIRAQAIRVETDTPWLLTPDGETFGSTPIDVGLLPRFLEVFSL